MAEKIFLAFVWHMHQPYYKDREKDIYLFPWVRLHGIKNYFNMVNILYDYPKIKQVFNLTPVLVMQLKDYVENRAKDLWLEKTLIPSTDLSEEDKEFILDRFFWLNFDKMASIHPRYNELWRKKQNKESFSSQDFLDLQVLYNLCWFDPEYRNKDEFLNYLWKKGKNYTESEKYRLVEKQFELLGKVLSLYKDLQDKGQIEVIFSPFYHPILPLLIDTDSARIATPNLPLPALPFRYPEDAKMQIKMGIDFYLENFGVYPKGMWPSEQAVSPEVIEMVSDFNLRWIITDEKILFKTLKKDLVRDLDGYLVEPHVLYKPYIVNIKGKKTNVVFRDSFLSDKIGFTYMHLSPEEAAKDLYQRLINIKNRLPNDFPYLVTIALDGENCWEYYDNDGRDFLRSFYSLLSNSSDIETITVGEYLEKFSPVDELNNIFTGSWVDADLTTWIGEKEENIAWNYLKIVRDFVEDKLEENESLKSKIDSVSLYAGEGSDWFWWFGDDQDSGHDEIFDYIFRQHLKNVYISLGEDPPYFLNVPIVIKKPLWLEREPLIMTPNIDGEISSEGEWADASLNLIDTKSRLLKGVYYAYDLDNLYIRVDTNIHPDEFFKHGYYIDFYFSHPQDSARNIYIRNKKRILGYPLSLNIRIKNSNNYELWKALGNEKWILIDRIKDLGVKNIFELKIPMQYFEGRKGEKINFTLIVYKEENPVEVFPEEDGFKFIIPGLLEEIFSKIVYKQRQDVSLNIYINSFLIPNREKYYHGYSKIYLTPDKNLPENVEEVYKGLIIRKYLNIEDLWLILQGVRELRRYNIADYKVSFPLKEVKRVNENKYILIPRDSLRNFVSIYFSQQKVAVFQKFLDLLGYIPKGREDLCWGSIEIIGL
ncbi:MAG: glycoside hydrolase family 57 [Dictyoglomus sp. NZ13-RE01]|nr:MAG: glycoside hydrolase family 57 [Dictyoglomus sp. NZ13-RE01]